VVAQNEDFGGSDGIEPFLNPAPNGREERRCTNDLCSQCRYSVVNITRGYKGRLQIFCPVSLGNELLLESKRLAYGTLDSRTA